MLYISGETIILWYFDINRPLPVSPCMQLLAQNWNGENIVIYLSLDAKIWCIEVVFIDKTFWYYFQVKDWTSAFLFSVETQQTIGYGGRSITTKCPEAAIILQLQSLVGIMIDAFLLGLTFAKLSRPRERMKTVLFSEHAVISLRDGKMCLVFRVGDVRKSQLVEAHIRLQLFRKTVTAEGHEFPFYQQNLRVCYDWRNYQEDDDRHQLFLLFPQDIVHIIDEKSPFYEITPEKLQRLHFELVVVLDGIVEATGLNMQAKCSYLNDEVLWGYDFKAMADGSQFDQEDLMFFADFSKLDDKYKTDLPTCSPREYYQQMKSLDTQGV